MHLEIFKVIAAFALLMSSARASGQEDSLQRALSALKVSGADLCVEDSLHPAISRAIILFESRYRQFGALRWPSCSTQSIRYASPSKIDRQQLRTIDYWIRLYLSPLQYESLRYQRAHYNGDDCVIGFTHNSKHRRYLQFCDGRSLLICLERSLACDDTAAISNSFLREIRDYVSIYSLTTTGRIRISDVSLCPDYCSFAVLDSSIYPNPLGECFEAVRELRKWRVVTTDRFVFIDIPKIRLPVPVRNTVISWQTIGGLLPTDPRKYARFLRSSFDPEQEMRAIYPWLRDSLNSWHLQGNEQGRKFFILQ